MLDIDQSVNRRKAPDIMLIETNTDTLSVTDAAGLIALLHTIHPEAIMLALQATAPGAAPHVAAATPPATPFVPQPPVATAAAPNPAVDALIAAEAARVAGVQQGIPQPPLATGVTVPQPPIAGTVPAPVATAGAPASSTVTQTLAPAAAMVAPAGVDVDANGFPWDARIHQSAKGQTVGKTWKYKKSLDPAIKESVEAELRALMSIPAVPVAQGLPAQQPVPQPPVQQVAPQQVAQPVPAYAGAGLPQQQPVPQPPVTQPVVQQAAAALGLDFAGLMMQVVDLQASGLLSPEMQAAYCAQVGVGSVRDLFHRPDLVPLFASLLPVAQ